MIEFGGWDMPVQYSGINDEHRAVRSSAGLFDTSHMGEIEVSGPGAREYLQRMMPNDINRLVPGGVLYNALLNENGGVIDDLMIYDKGDGVYLLCVNASNTDKDFAWLAGRAGDGVNVTNLSDDTAMLALQGPLSPKILTGLTDAEIDSLEYLHFVEAPVADVDCIISRGGYTGEDGFELYAPGGFAESLWRSIMESGEEFGIVPAGLGARDTLRLEMGYSLYGNELDEDHTPLESGISWICRWDKGDFVGRDALIKQREVGVKNKLVGLEMIDRGVPRHGYAVMDGDIEVGLVTSGTMSPSLGLGIALARIMVQTLQRGVELNISIHGKPRKARIVDLPFLNKK